MSHNFGRTEARRRRGGFTLVELLVVVVIIIVLAGLTIPAVMWAFSAAQETRIRAEVSGLSEAMERYRQEYGDYPPDFSDAALVTRHWQKRFPRTTQSPPTGLTRAEALVFWLNGFGPNVTAPLTTSPAGTPSSPLFPFDKARLKNTRTLNSWPIYTYEPQDGQGAPYAYFAAPTYTHAAATFSGGMGGTARPYLSAFGSGSGSSLYANPTSFQIISAGLDGNYGNNTTKTYPTGTGYNDQDNDNITNFCTRTLGDDRE